MHGGVGDVEVLAGELGVRGEGLADSCHEDGQGDGQVRAGTWVGDEVATGAARVRRHGSSCRDSYVRAVPSERVVEASAPDLRVADLCGPVPLW